MKRDVISWRVSFKTSDGRSIKLPHLFPSPASGLLTCSFLYTFTKLYCVFFRESLIMNYHVKKAAAFFNLKSVKLAHIGWDNKALVSIETDELRGWKRETLSYLLTWNLPPLRVYEADVSSVNPSSEQSHRALTKVWHLERQLCKLTTTL